MPHLNMDIHNMNLFKSDAMNRYVKKLFYHAYTLTYNIMDGFVEGIVFREDEENDERHVDVV